MRGFTLSEAWMGEVGSRKGEGEAGEEGENTNRNKKEEEVMGDSFIKI